jgi:ribosomal-protein-alanine N-acetyltransferase
VLETERLVLRPYVLADAPSVQRMCGDPAIAATTLAIPHPYPDGAAEKWISTHAESFRQGIDVTLAITLKPDRPVIGSVACRSTRTTGAENSGTWSQRNTGTGVTALRLPGR